MTAAIVVILIAGALLGLYLWSKRAGAGAGAGGASVDSQVRTKLAEVASKRRGPMTGAELGATMGAAGKTGWDFFGAVWAPKISGTTETAAERDARLDAQVTREAGYVATLAASVADLDARIAAAGGGLYDSRGYVVSRNANGGHDWWFGATSWSSGRPVYPMGVHGAPLEPYTAGGTPNDRRSLAVLTAVYGDMGPTS